MENNWTKVISISISITLLEREREREGTFPKKKKGKRKERRRSTKFHGRKVFLSSSGRAIAVGGDGKLWRLSIDTGVPVHVEEFSGRSVSRSPVPLA